MKRRGGYMIPHLPHGAAQRQGETRGFCGDLLERAVFLGAFGVTSGWLVLSGYLEAYPIRLQALERWEQKDFALQVPELIHECRFLMLVPMICVCTVYFHKVFCVPFAWSVTGSLVCVL